MIFTSCIEQLWATVKVKTVNREVQLQALVDGKKIIITEASIRSYLQLNDKEGMDCLPNGTIFEELTRMGFVQVFLDKQLEGMSSHKRIYVTPSHTKKIFGNMKRVGKGFLGRETPLFPTMKQRSRRPKRKDTEVPQPSGPTTNVVDEAVYEERDDSLERTATTATGLDAEQDRGNIDKTQYKATPNELSSLGTSSCGNTLRSGEDRLKLQELMELCTNLQNRVIDLEKTKTTQAREITSLKLRVKKLEKKGGSRTHKLKRLYKGRYGNEDMFRVNDLEGDEVIVEIEVDHEVVVKTEVASKDVNLIEQGVPDSKKDDAAQVNTIVITVSTASAIPVSATSITDVEITLAQALTELKSVKPTTATSTRFRAKGLVIQEQEQAPTPIVCSQQPSRAKIQDKGKAKMIEPEPVRKLSKKDQLKRDEEVAQRLQAEFDAQEKIEREKAEANIALKETWDDIQEEIEADQLLAERLQAREQEELTIEERAILFQQLLEKKRKHFAAKRAEDKRNRPPTKAQQRSIMCSYLKNMEGWKPKDLKSKSFANIQELFDKAMKMVNTFVDYRTELVEGSSKKVDAEIAQESSSKRAEDELEQESIKKQKVGEDKETAELKSLMEVIPDEEEVAVNVIPLATKPPSIVDWKIYKEGKKSYYQIIMADGSSKMYLMFSHMLKSFDRKDLETLYKLVKAKYRLTRPVEDLDLVLYGDLKTMFDPHVEDQLSMKKLEILKKNIKFRGGLLNDLGVTTAKVCVTAAK
ncbi:hypothetical protein Tco_0622182 [Tanacetum coccineum]